MNVADIVLESETTLVDELSPLGRLGNRTSFGSGVHHKMPKLGFKTEICINAKK